MSERPGPTEGRLLGQEEASYPHSPGRRCPKPLDSRVQPGKTHDKGLLNAEGWAEWIPDDVKIQGDLGFQGLQNEYVNVEIPHKKPKGGQLSDEQKAENQALARERVVSEHAFAGLKRYGIAAQVYRNRKENFDDRSIFTAAGLWNFYLMAA